MKVKKLGFGLSKTRCLSMICLGGMMFSLGTMAVPSGTIADTPPSNSLVLDTFASPGDPSTRVVYGQPQTSHATVTINESNLTSVPSGARDTILRLYDNPLNSVAALGVGNGDVSVAQGTGLKAETLISYGGFTRVGGNPKVGGPSLRLNLSNYKNLQLDFAGAEDYLNISVTYYTDSPLPSNPNSYYTNSGVNIAPSSRNAPVSLKLPLNNDPTFNWQHVNGIVVIINRSGPTASTSYTLKSLTFVP